MGVMFFRQGANFDQRYAGQMVQRSGGAVTVQQVQTLMWGQHITPPALQGKTTPNIPQEGHDSFIKNYSNKIQQLQWLIEPPTQNDAPSVINSDEI